MLDSCQGREEQGALAPGSTSAGIITFLQLLRTVVAEPPHVWRDERGAQDALSAILGATR